MNVGDVEYGVFISPTPKAMRVQELLDHGMGFNEAFAIADREYISDGISLKWEAALGLLNHNTILCSGVPQMGEVQI